MDANLINCWRIIEDLFLIWLSRAVQSDSDMQQIFSVCEQAELLIAAGHARKLYFLVFRLISRWLTFQKKKLFTCSDESFVCLYKTILKTALNVICGDINECFPRAGWRVKQNHIEEIRRILFDEFILNRLLQILRITTPMSTTEYIRTGRAFGAEHSMREEYIDERNHYNERREINSYLHTLHPEWKRKRTLTLFHLSANTILSTLSFNSASGCKVCR